MRSTNGHTELSQGELLVGRSRSCQVVLRDPSVSRSHALITVAGDLLTLKDLASSNGTFINGKKVEGEADLAAGDTLTFGETQLELTLLDREDAFSFAGLIEEVEFETAESRSFDPILETLKPGGMAAEGSSSQPAKMDPPASKTPGDFLSAAAGEPRLEIDGTPMAGVPPTFEEPLVEPLDESLDEDFLLDLPLDEALEELDALFPEESDPGDETGLPGEIEPPEERTFAPRASREKAPSPPPPVAPPPPKASPPTPMPPKAKSKPDIAPSFGSREMKLVVERLQKEDDGVDLSPSPGPSRDNSFLDETAGELLPSLSDLDELDALGAPPLGSSSLGFPSPSTTAPRSGAGRASGKTGSLAKAPAASGSVAALDRMPKRRPAAAALPAAGFGIRLLAAILDGMLVMVVAGAISLLVGGPWLAEGGAVFLSVIVSLSFVLHVFGWNIWGTTPAKRLFGLYVCPIGGEPGIGVGSAVLRFLGYAVGILSLGLGFLMVAFTPGRRGLHDVIAGTYVGRWQR